MHSDSRVFGTIGVIVGLLLSATVGLAGSLEPSVGPTEAGSQMYTLHQIYDRLNAGTMGSKMTSFTEPTGGPVGTGRTLDEIMVKLPVLDDADGAGPADVVGGKTYWGLTSGQWGLKTGTMPTQALLPGSAAVPAGYYQTTNLTTVDPDLATGNIKAGVTIFGVSGKMQVVDTASGDAMVGNILAGRKAWVDGQELTGTIAPRTLSAVNSTVNAGYYAATTLTTLDLNLEAGNIRKDVSIFGVVGTYDVWSPGTAPIARTGQTIPIETRDDGALRKGVAWPNPRFTDNANGTVTDNLTGLIWLRDANCFGAKPWETALNDANALANGSCNLTDGSAAGQWRLPNVNELQSLIDYAYGYYGYFAPALSNTAGTGKWTPGNPFTNVQIDDYWSSSSYVGGNDYAWIVGMWYGNDDGLTKGSTSYIWPVRGGQ